jgi:hypothetical protein
LPVQVGDIGGDLAVRQFEGDCLADEVGPRSGWLSNEYGVCLAFDRVTVFWAAENVRRPMMTNSEPRRLISWLPIR